MPDSAHSSPAASPAPLVLIANARMPSERAQSLQVAQVAAAFERAGAPTTLLHARRRDTPAIEEAALWEHYGVPPGPRPRARAVACLDWIDRCPRRLQYAPARLQELTFARNAARLVRSEFDGARVLSREIESAHALRGRRGLFLELHRVPGGRLRRRWLLKAAAGAAGIVAISEGVRQDLLGLGLDGERIVVEHDGFEPTRFAAAVSRGEARERLDLPGERAVVVYTGGLLAWKGVDLLVQAARELPEALVVIAGGMGADVERLRARVGASENVRIDGFQPPSRVPLYLAAADLGVVPNRSQPPISARYTSPLKVFEAMAVGLPLVVSDLPSLRELLSPEEALFVAPDDPQALARGIQSLLEDDARRVAAAERLRSRAPRHTWDARAARLLEWMEVLA